MSETPRCVLHADMDAFFAAVEQRDAKELRGRPVVVGGLSARGVVAAASYEARAFGIHSAMPTAQARKLCPSAAFLRGDHARYARESRRIFKIFHAFTPRVEGLSLDEAFLDLTGSARLLGPPEAVAHELRARVRRETGLAVSCGVAPVKLVAKMASEAAKPDGVLVIRADEVREFLTPLPVGRLWGVGPVAGARLARLGIHSVGDLARAGRTNPARLERALGRAGLALAKLARGEDMREVEPLRETVSLSEEHTFERDVAERRVLEAALLTHAESVARRLRRGGLCARTVTLKIKFARRVAAGARGFVQRTPRTTLAEPTDDGAVLAAAARALLARNVFARGKQPAPLRLIGVGATNLCAAVPEQLALLPEPQTRARRRRLNRSVDALTERYGKGAVRLAGEGVAARASPSLKRKRGDSK